MSPCTEKSSHTWLSYRVIYSWVELPGGLVELPGFGWVELPGNLVELPGFVQRSAAKESNSHAV